MLLLGGEQPSALLGVGRAGKESPEEKFQLGRRVGAGFQSGCQYGFFMAQVGFQRTIQKHQRLRHIGIHCKSIDRFTV